MSPVMTNTQEGLITVPAAADFSGNVGCFAKIDSTGKAALPTSHGLALYIVEDAYDGSAYTSSGYQAVLRPLSPQRNMRVISAAVLTCGSAITTDGAGKAVAASTGNNVLAYTEESAVVGQYVLIRPLGGVQTA